MYYSYETIISLSLDFTAYTFNEETLNIITELKHILLIHNKTEPFKITKIHKQLDYCGTICKLLNKLSEKNYEKLKIELFDLIANIDSTDDIDIITNRIFNIASSNIHLSKLFSTLYKELIEKNSMFYVIFQDNFIKHSKVLSEIKYVSPNENYDEYCNYVKKIDQLKSGLSFFSNLMKFNICSMDNLVDLCKELLASLMIEMTHSNNMEYKEELLQSIFIIIKDTLDSLAFHKDWATIFDTIVGLKSHKNINPKLRFKCMDIIDYVNSYTL